MGTDRTTRTATISIALSAGLFLLLGSVSGLASDDLHLIIAPNSATVSTEGSVDFDAYLYNGGTRPIKAPAPQAGFKVVWTLRDVCKLRPDRDGANSVIGTHTVDPYVIASKTAVRCEHLSASVQSEPGDVLEFYITIERKIKSGVVEPIRSNSVTVYRPK